MSQQNATAGWYRDVTGTLRWWDGAVWTAHVSPEPAAQAAAPMPDVTPAYAASPQGFLPQSLPADTVGTVGTAVLPGPTTSHRSAQVLDAYAPAAMPYLRAVPQRDVPHAITLVLIGLACLAGGVATFELAMPHGGLVWTGGLLFGLILVLRGVGELVRPGSSRPRPGSWEGSSLAHPYAAHQATRAAASRGPRRGRFVSGWVVLACAVGMAAVVLAIVVWPTGGSSVPPASAATHPAATSSDRTGTTASSTKHAAADTGPWVPDRKHDWTPVGTTAAYASLSTSSGDCDPGTSCQRILVASKHACSDLRVRAQFYGLNNAVVATTTLHLRRVHAGKPVAVRLESQGFLFSASVTSIRCV